MIKVTHDLPSDRSALDLDHWRHDLGNTLSVISARTRLQHRMTLRSSKLTDLERSQSLTNLDAVLMAVEGLSVQIEALLRGEQILHRESPPETSS